MIRGVVLGFVLGAPIWFALGMALMGRLCSNEPVAVRQDLEGDEGTELGRVAQR